MDYLLNINLQIEIIIYYDDELFELISEKDKKYINHFGYKF